MYLIEMQRITKKLHKKGGVTVKGILVSIRRTIPGNQSQTDLLADRFYESNAGSIQLQEGIDQDVLILQDPHAQKEIKP